MLQVSILKPFFTFCPEFLVGILTAYSYRTIVENHKGLLEEHNTYKEDVFVRE